MSKEQHLNSFEHLRQELKVARRLVREGFLDAGILGIKQNEVSKLQAITGQSESYVQPSLVSVVEEGSNFKKEKKNRGMGVVALPDSQNIKTGRLRCKLINKLSEVYGQEPINAEDLEIHLYGANNQQNNEKLWRLVSATRNLLESIGWRIGHQRRNKMGGKGTYYFEKIATSDRLIEAKEQERPMLVISQDNKQIEFVGQVMRLPDRQIKLLRSLASHVDEKMGSRELSKEAFGDPDPIKTSLRDHFRRLRNKINVLGAGDFLESFNKNKKKAWYKLSGVEIVWLDKIEAEGDIEDKRGSEEELREVETKATIGPTGLTNIEQKVYDKIAEGTKAEPIVTSQIIVSIYPGVEIEAARDRLSVCLSSIRKKLGPQEIKINSVRRGKEEATYYVEKVEEADATDLDESFIEIDTEKDETVVNSPEDFVEIEEMRYVRSEEEKRTKEETRILSVIIGLLAINPQNPKILYEEIHSGLRSEIQEKSKEARPGKRSYRIYQAEELRDKLESAFRKLRQEAAIQREREVWTDDDKGLWESVETLVKETYFGDFDEFLKRTKLRINQSQRRFYREYKSERGGQIGYIEK